MRAPRKALFIALILLATVLQFPLAISDPGWLAGWDYRKSHTITGSVAGVQTDYQMKLGLDYGAGVDSGSVVYLDSKCETDFGDIRFTSSDGTTLLDYWIEDKTDSDSAIIWVEIPNIPESPDNATIYIYYGKVGETTSSNGPNTFPLFDDFNRGNSGTVGEGWTEDEDAGTGALSIDTNRLKVIQNQNYYCHIEKVAPALTTFILRGKVYVVARDTGASWKPGIFVYWGEYDWIQIGLYTHWSNPTKHQTTWDKAGVWGGVAGQAGNIGTWYYYRLRVNTNTVYFEFSADGGSWTQVTGSSTARPGSWSGAADLIVIGKGLSGNAGSYPNADLDNSYVDSGASKTSYSDEVFVRNYVDPEPTHGDWGEEEEPLPLEVPDKLFGAGFNASSPYVSLYWKTNLTDITLFEVQNSTDKITWEYLGSNTTAEYHDFQVINGTERYYRVRACNFTDPVWDNSTFTDINFETVYFVEATAAGDTYLTGSIGIFLIAFIILLPITFYMVKRR